MRPLSGLPFGVKDIIDTHDMPTSYGSPIHAGHQPSADAACVALARKPAP
jgi:amidase